MHLYDGLDQTPAFSEDIKIERNHIVYSRNFNIIITCPNNLKLSDKLLLTLIKSLANGAIFGIKVDKSFRTDVTKFERNTLVSVGHSLTFGVPMIKNIRVN